MVNCNYISSVQCLPLEPKKLGRQRQVCCSFFNQEKSKPSNQHTSLDCIINILWLYTFFIGMKSADITACCSCKASKVEELGTRRWRLWGGIHRFVYGLCMARPPLSVVKLFQQCPAAVDFIWFYMILKYSKHVEDCSNLSCTSVWVHALIDVVENDLPGAKSRRLRVEETVIDWFGRAWHGQLATWCSPNHEYCRCISMMSELDGNQKQATHPPYCSRTSRSLRLSMAQQSRFDWTLPSKPPEAWAVPKGNAHCGEDSERWSQTTWDDGNLERGDRCWEMLRNSQNIFLFAQAVIWSHQTTWFLYGSISFLQNYCKSHTCGACLAP